MILLNLRKALILFILVMGVVRLQAQNDSLFKSPISGGFGHFFIGPAYFQSKKITDYLKNSDILGSSYSPSTMGYTIGGEGLGVRGRFLIGGGGFAITTPTKSTNIGRASVNLGGGYLKVGYRFYEKPNTFMFAHASFGGSGYTILLSNLSDSTSLKFNKKAPIAPNKKQIYSIGGFLFDLGASLKSIAFSQKNEISKTKSGLVLGVDAGLLILLPISEWTNENNVVLGPPDPNSFLSPYIRITIGGGGFRY